MRGSQPKGQHEVGDLADFGLADRDHWMSLRSDPALPVWVGEERVVREDGLDLAWHVAVRGDVDMNVSRDLPVPITQPHFLRIAARPDRVQLEPSVLAGLKRAGETSMRLIHGLIGCIAAAGVGLVDVQPSAGHGFAALADDAAMDREALPRLRVADQRDGAARRRSSPPCDWDNESGGQEGKEEPEWCYPSRLPGCESPKHVEINGMAVSGGAARFLCEFRPLDCPVLRSWSWSAAKALSLVSPLSGGPPREAAGQGGSGQWGVFGAGGIFETAGQGGRGSGSGGEMAIIRSYALNAMLTTLHNHTT